MTQNAPEQAAGRPEAGRATPLPADRTALDRRGFAALAGAAHGILESDSFEKSARILFETCAAVIGARSGFVALLSDDETRHEPVFLELDEAPEGDEFEDSVPISALQANAYRTGRTILENDSPDCRWLASPTASQRRSPENVIYAPLVLHRRALGLLAVADKPGGFTAQDVEVTTAFSDLCAGALRSFQLARDLEHGGEPVEAPAVAEPATPPPEEPLDPRSQQTLLQTTFDSTPGFLTMKDRELAYRLVNRAFCESLGKTEDEILGKTDQELFPEEQALAHGGGDLEVLSTGEPRRTEQEMEGEDGKRWLHVVKSPVLDQEGVCHGVLCSVIDITEHRQAEEQLRDHASQQEILLREVNHRVRNNLLALLGVLHKEVDRSKALGHSSEITPLLDLEQRIKGLATVHDLLSNVGWRSLPLTQICEAVIGGAVEGFRGSSETHISVSPSPVRVGSTQAHHLTMILSELATNSMKHAPADRAQVSIHVEVECDGAGVCLRYRDDGPGFSDQVLRGDVPGTSIGLGLVRGIATHSLGGELELYNDDGASVALRFSLDGVDDPG